MRLTKKQAERVAQLLPNGEPRWIRCYDDGGETIDRYTVVYTGKRGGYYVGMSGAPYHPQGFCQHGEGLVDVPNGSWPPAIGRKNHLGTRIAFSELPIDCKRVVLQDYCHTWGLPLPDYATMPSIVLASDF